MLRVKSRFSQCSNRGATNGIGNWRLTWTISLDPSVMLPFSPTAVLLLLWPCTLTATLTSSVCLQKIRGFLQSAQEHAQMSTHNVSAFLNVQKYPFLK